VVNITDLENELADSLADDLVDSLSIPVPAAARTPAIATDGPPTRSVSLRVPTDVYNALASKAEMENQTISALANRALLGMACGFPEVVETAAAPAMIESDPAPADTLDAAPHRLLVASGCGAKGVFDDYAGIEGRLRDQLDPYAEGKVWPGAAMVIEGLPTACR
jgi:hypothetical protein